MKILSGYPNGLASQVDIKRDLAILATSGRDWECYSKRLAAAFPSLDIFSSGMVQIYSFGWRLTTTGSIALEMMEEAARNAAVAPHAVLPTSEAEHSERVLPKIVAAADPLPSERAVDRRALFTVIDGGRNEAA